MALISCPECNKKISDLAASCPSCGVPMSESGDYEDSSNRHTTTTRGGAKWEGFGFLMIVGGMIYGMGSGPSNHIGGIVMGIGFILFLIGRFN